MNAHGLTIDRRTGSLTVPVRAITPEVLGTGLELALLAVKSPGYAGRPGGAGAAPGR